MTTVSLRERCDSAHTRPINLTTHTLSPREHCWGGLIRWAPVTSKPVRGRNRRVGGVSVLQNLTDFRYTVLCTFPSASANLHPADRVHRACNLEC